MTHTSRFPVLATAALALALLALPTARAGDDPADQDVVARCLGKVMTRQNLAPAMVWRVRQEFLDKGSGPTTILNQMIEERVVAQEAKRLGIVVTDADVQTRYSDYDTEVRHRTNGAKTLREVIIRDQKSSMSEFMKNLKDQILRERVAGHQEYLGRLPKNETAKLAQIDMVIVKLRAKAKIEIGFATALQAPPSKLAPGVVATVNGEPITVQELGAELIDRLPADQVKGIVEEECEAVLTSQYALSPEQMDAVIQQERAQWEKVRETTTQEAWKSVSYEDWVKVRYKLDVEQMKQNRFFRGLYGLVQKMREQVKPEDVQKEYKAKKNSVYGDRFLVTDVQISFSPRQPMLGASVGRERKDALQIANRILRQEASGVPFDDIVRQINDKRDKTFFARRLRVRNTDNEQLLYDQAKRLQDGQISAPFETLAEVHLLRREKWMPAPTFDEAKDLVLSSLARWKASEWLKAQMDDKTKVQIFWPPADRTAD